MAVAEMLPVLQKKVMYFDSALPFCAEELGDQLNKMLCVRLRKGMTLIFLCIGSDRATGDCLGPLLGHKLCIFGYPAHCVYGTLSAPVHARNLEEVLLRIYAEHTNPFVVAVDASLGKASHIGFITIGDGALRPGAGVDKTLPPAGDLHITGIVNLSGMLDHMLLQTTRLSVVMTLTDLILSGIGCCLQKGLPI